jgi:hypothetical protein
MAKLDADMQSLVRRTILCFAATINGDGSPNLSRAQPRCAPSMAMPSRSTMPCLSGCFLPNQFFHPPTLLFRA